MPTNKELYQTKMDALAQSINTKAGTTGAKTLDQLKTAVDSIQTGDPLPTPKSSLNSYTWAEIGQLANAVAEGTLSSATLTSTYHISIGNTKTSSINDETHQYRLIGLAHDVDANNKTLGMTFEQVDLTAHEYSMISGTMLETDSWDSSDLKEIIGAMNVASDLAAVIIPARKVCAKNVSAGTPVYHEVNMANGLWLLSETEIKGTATMTIDNTSEGTRYEYYTNGGGATKSRQDVVDYYWTRSPNSWENSTSSFVCITDDGTADASASSSILGIAPCFCVGRNSNIDTSDATITYAYNTESGRYESLQLVSNVTAYRDGNKIYGNMSVYHGEVERLGGTD